jgi:DNA-binding GntR family transcriptional regulator
MIFNGILASGQKVDEKALCEALGVSRTPVREALRTLNSERLINLIPYRGSFVAEYKKKDINDIYEVMGTLYGTAARLAVHSMSDADLKRMVNLHQKLEKYYRSKNHKSYLKVNSVFHDFNLKLSDNKVLKDVIESRLNVVIIFSNRSLYQPNRFKQSIQEHREIMSAFRKRDPELAEASMKLHFMNQGHALLPLFD